MITLKFPADSNELEVVKSLTDIFCASTSSGLVNIFG